MVSLSKKHNNASLQQNYKASKKIKQHHKEIKKTLKTECFGTSLLVSKELPRTIPVSNNKQSTKPKIASEFDKRKLMALKLLNKHEPVAEVEDNLKIIKDSSRAFVGDIRKLIEESDIILLVLDARDPLGTRSLESEKIIKLANKKIIFILNKIDLIPNENMKAWLAYLGKEAKTFPFKANCQQQAKNLGSSSGARPSIDLDGSSASYGIDNLINYMRSLNKKSNPFGISGKKSVDKLVIGVAGVPNTGKSSVINSLKRKRICEAGNVAGLTRNLQHVAIDNHIVMIDSPGIVLAKSTDPAEYALRNCVRVEKIEDPISVVEAIYKRCPNAQLQCIYKLPSFNSFKEFIATFAQRMCPLKKGGILDLNLAAVKLINDWNNGKIAYYSEPPLSNESMETSEHTGLEIDDCSIKSVATNNACGEYENVDMIE